LRDISRRVGAVVLLALFIYALIVRIILGTT
jgi:hypothetical protein